MFLKHNVLSVFIFRDNVQTTDSMAINKPNFWLQKKKKATKTLLLFKKKQYLFWKTI